MSDALPSILQASCCYLRQVGSFVALALVEQGSSGWRKGAGISPGLSSPGFFSS